MNRNFKQYLMDNSVLSIAARPPLKASMAEPGGKLLKRKIWRYITARKSKKFIDELPSLVCSLNSRPMAVLGGRAPKDVTLKNQMDIYYRRYGKYRNRKTRNFKFLPGTYVRLANKRDPFAKAFLPGFSEEVYVIDAQIPHYPKGKYRLKDLLGNQIAYTYYEEELTEVRIPEHQQ